jgi:hypothetical protein
MIKHEDIGTSPEGKKKLGQLIRNGEISLGGNLKLKIYGLLNCSSGKRMKPANRVFFKNESEAVVRGYRPCGHCLHEKYKRWKAGKEWVDTIETDYQIRR